MVNLHYLLTSFVDYHGGWTAALLRVVNMKKRRHTAAEIEALLDRADTMSAEGRPNGEIAKALNVSIMTYHRWRKTRAALSLAVGSQHGAESKTAPVEQAARIGELQLENLRLRRLVTDLLLEKMTLEEGDHGGAGARTAPR